MLDLLEAHLELLPVEPRVAVREHLVRHQLEVVRPEIRGGKEGTLIFLYL